MTKNKALGVSLPLSGREPQSEPQVDYFEKLIELMEILRGPEGCPWDREQTPEKMKPMLIEEAYEVLEALDGDSPEELCEELGDLLFQIIFHSQIAHERGDFDAREVCRKVYEKMVLRHPHVFGGSSFKDSRELLKNWEEIKTAEKKAAGRAHRKSSLLEGIPAALPALYTTYQITSKASRVGFDWPDLEGVHQKIEEEFEELSQALQTGDERRIREEVGDLLFAAVNVARILEIDPETALQGANQKFYRRFLAMEKHFEANGKLLKEATPAEMETVWQQQKQSGG